MTYRQTRPVDTLLSLLMSSALLFACALTSTALVPTSSASSSLVELSQSLFLHQPSGPSLSTRRRRWKMPSITAALLLLRADKHKWPSHVVLPPPSHIPYSAQKATCSSLTLNPNSATNGRGRAAQEGRPDADSTTTEQDRQVQVSQSDDRKQWMNG